MTHFVTLLLGSNLGDREALLQQARTQIGKRIGLVRKASKIYESAPWGFFDKPSDKIPAFLNQALEIETKLTPEKILAETQKIERELGRKKSIMFALEKTVYESRAIDIDILFYDDETIDRKELTIPHPRIPDRRFVLEPLAEIMPERMHPILKISIKELLNSILLKESQ